MTRRLPISLLALVACTPPSSGPATPTRDQGSVGAAPAAPALAKSRRHDPAAVGADVVALERLHLATPMLLRSEGGAPRAVSDVLLVVLAGPAASQALEHGETVGGTWMLNRVQGELVGFSPDGQRVALVAADPGDALVDSVVWLRPRRDALAPAKGDNAAATTQRLARLARGELPGLWLGDGTRALLAISGPVPIADARALRLRAQAQLHKGTGATP